MAASTYSRAQFLMDHGQEIKEQEAIDRLYKDIFYEEYKRKYEAEIRNKIRHQLDKDE